MRLDEFDKLIPFSCSRSAYVNKIRAEHYLWMHEIRLISTPMEFEIYRTWRLPEYAGALYHDATKDGLRLGADLMGWFFPFDDYFDGLNDLRQVQAIVDVMIDIVHDWPGTMPEIALPMVTAFADIWRRSRGRMSPTWAARAAENWTEYFTSYGKEAAARATSAPITIDQCIAMRRESLALLPSVDLNEPATGFEVPARLWRHPQLQHMLRTTTDGISLMNDVWSADKEATAGEPFNSVLVLQSATGCSRGEAINEITCRFGALIGEFIEKEDRLPAVFDELHLEEAERIIARQYVAHLRNWFRATYDWYSATGRYHGNPVLSAESGRELEK